jgi:hypothetical protein
MEWAPLVAAAAAAIVVVVCNVLVCLGICIA